MSKSLFKPAWLAASGIVIALGVAIKVALALDAFSPAQSPIGYVAQDEVTDFNFKRGDVKLFRGEYEREFWSGTVYAYTADENGNLTGGTSWWDADAGEKISGQNPNTGRKIATMKDNGIGVSFRLGSLSATQAGYFDDDNNILDYLRGDRSKELPGAGGLFRQRVSVMGDVVHSRPYYVADDANPTLFVGANDGMLHAINASKGGEGGKERWAYVPSMLLSKMKKLTVDPYVHDYFVDGQINVATIASGTKRALVGALGLGGKGLFALDITDSAGLEAADEAAVASKVMWEITPTTVNYAAPTVASAYENLGYSYGSVVIAPVKVGVTTVDAVIVGNGYNDGGDYGSYLFVINADTGQLIKRFKAGTGTAASPNGLSTPFAVDADRDGKADTVYAGDLNGSMWKFDLSDLSDAASVATTATTPGVKLLLATSPAQAITVTPGVAIHPEGGYMVTFATGKTFVDADLADNAVHYVYGVWDGAPAANDTLLTQTLQERNYVGGDGVSLRVRRATTTNLPNWSDGAGNHKGWKVALNAGERVVGQGSFIENGRYYFQSYNPTISTKVANTDTTVQGENWLLELDYLTGGAPEQPFLDLSGDVLLTDLDRIKYIDGDALPVGKASGDRIMDRTGVPLGKFVSIGVLSQPILVQLVTLNDTLFNQNPDVIVPSPNVDRGVEGGHFDVEIYYGTTTATITVANPATGAGQTNGYPATLGAITVDGVEVVPALTVADLTNGGGSANTSANVIKNKATNGFSATRSNNVVTIKAPNVSYLGKTLVVADGTSQALVAASAATAPAAGTVVITDAARNRNVSMSCGGTPVTNSVAVPDSGSKSNRLDAVYTGFHNVTKNGYKPSCNKTIVAGSTTQLTCTITAPAGPSACAAGFTLDNDLTASSNTGPTGGAAAVAKSGWTNFKPALTVTAFDNGGGNASIVGDTCNGGNSRCTYKEHDHEYDDIYDKTGVNFLDASNSNFNLSRAIPSTLTQFKVIAQNQYLSPAARLHIGKGPGTEGFYLFNVDQGYINIKTYTTSNALDLATLPTYTRNTIGSLAINLPTTAFSNRDWWGGYLGLAEDVRDGLHPTEAGCVFTSASATEDGNMYRPVNPPAVVTASGNGTRGWSAATTQSTATGVRHNGALTLQIIRADTPNAAIEQSIPGRPEYGYRVKADLYATYVLASYSMFHHSKHLGLCYGDENVSFTLYGVDYTNVSWTKTPIKDTRICGGSDTSITKRCAADKSANAGPDPKIGDLGGGSDIVSTVTTVVANVTTTVITYSSGAKATIVRTVRADGSIEIVSTDIFGDQTTEIIANKKGDIKKGGDEKGLQARTGRISWRELVAP
jgi:hypothetical protein